MHTLLLLSDYAAVAQGLSVMLGPEYVLKALPPHATLAEGLKQGDHALVLLDTQWRGGQHFGITLRQCVSYKTPTVLFGYSLYSHTLADAIIMGAHGYLPPSTQPAEWRAALQQVLAQQYVFSPDQVLSTVRHMGELVPELSERERGILDLLLLNENMENLEIAKKLNLSTGRTKNVLTGIYRKFNVETRHQLIHVARQRGYYPGMPLEMYAKFFKKYGLQKPRRAHGA
ncbi:LuxR C-terminal-related transcriptional regulator [Massilia sp. W12]|uniref:response regulator transcription factor n=1 Tax=Massilia sp. W12 TaxID=3126507 RepID=UPI0030D62197